MTASSESKQQNTQPGDGEDRAAGRETGLADQSAAEHSNFRGVNWDDPERPAGDAPPMSKWPLVASVVAFALWLVFLVAMAALRVRTTSV